MRLRVAILTAIFWGQLSYAYLSILESGEIVAKDHYQLGVKPQILLNEGGGFNIGSYLDQPIADSLSARYHLGVGKIDFHLGAGVKWIPIPDVDHQPALGVRVTGWYARTKNENVLTLQFAPMVSKKVPTDNVLLVPYLAVPLNVVSAKEKSYTGTQFIMGSEFKFESQPDYLYAAEVSVNLKDSYSYVSGSMSFPFDVNTGFRKSKKKIIKD